MTLDRWLAYSLLAVAALAFGFLLSTQLRTQLINPSNRVERNQALVRTVRELEGTNAADRKRITALRGEIAGLEADASLRSGTTHRLADEVDTLRAHAGMVPLHGPGVTVQLVNGRPGSEIEGRSGYQVNFEDVQDLVNLLYEGGAEGLAVNGRRLSPASVFRGSGGAVIVDQGPPLASPFRIAAVGNRSQMEQLLAEPASLGDLKDRQRRFHLALDWTGAPDLALPAYDSSLEVANARPL